jgi:hypothetical protein
VGGRSETAHPTDRALFSTASIGGSEPPALPNVLSGSTAHIASRRAVAMTQRATASLGDAEDDENVEVPFEVDGVLVEAASAEPSMSAGTS